METELEFEIEKPPISIKQEYWEKQCEIIYLGLKNKSEMCVTKELENGCYQIWHKFIYDLHVKKEPIQKYKVVYSIGGNE